MNNELLDEALGLYNKGLQPIPLGEITLEEAGENKKPKKKFSPTIKWQAKNTPFSRDEVTKNFSSLGVKNVAIRAGKIPGAKKEVFTIDIDLGADEEFVEEFKKNTPKTVHYKTQSGASQYVFLYPKNIEIKSSNSKLAVNVDVKGDDSISITPKSKTTCGGTYEYINSFEDIEIAEAPEWLINKLKEISSASKKNWKKFIYEKHYEGTRHSAATEYAGHLLVCSSVNKWDEEWQKFTRWNESQNIPTLEEKELLSIWDSLKEKESKKRETQKTETKKSQADLLLEIIDEKVQQEEIILFHSDLKEPYASVKINERQVTLSCKNKAFNLFLCRLYRQKFNKAIGTEALRNALNNIEQIALFDGKEIKLFNRVAWHDGALWYDLADVGQRAVKITATGWDIVDNPPILFRRYSHQKAQVEPQKNDDIRLFSKYVNLKDKRMVLLFLIYLVTCFIPGFPHTVLNLHGVKGSGKSTPFRLLKRLIDPSSMELTGQIRNEEQLNQILYHHWCLFLDNVSDLKDWLSDALCRAVTGDGSSKRALYSDDDDIIYSFQRCIGFNGINNIATKSDLTERCLSFELDRISEEQRVSEEKLFEDFEKDRPLILGGIFNTISKALQIKPNIKLKFIPRMADFTIWGCAIAEAMGEKQTDFLSPYKAVIQNQNEDVVSESLVAQTVISLMESQDKWDGTPSELLTALEKKAEKLGIKTTEQGFPKAANTLSRELNKLKTDLETVEIKIWRDKGKKRTIHIQKVEKNTVGTDETVGMGQKDSDLGDDTNDDTQQEQVHQPSPGNSENNEELSIVDDIDDKNGKNPVYRKWTEDEPFEDEKRLALPKVTDQNNSMSGDGVNNSSNNNDSDNSKNIPRAFIIKTLSYDKDRGIDGTLEENIRCRADSAGLNRNQVIEELNQLITEGKVKPEKDGPHTRYKKWTDDK